MDFSFPTSDRSAGVDTPRVRRIGLGDGNKDEIPDRQAQDERGGVRYWFEQLRDGSIAEHTIKNTSKDGDYRTRS